MAQQEYVVFSPDGNVAQQTPPPKGRGCCLGGCLGAVVMVLVCCGGLGVFLYFGYQYFNDEVARLLAANPVAQEHLGDVQEVRFDLRALSEREDPDTLPFRVRGSKGDATVFLVPESLQREEVDGLLVMPDGTEHDLTPEAETDGKGEAQGEVEMEVEEAAPPAEAP